MRVGSEGSRSEPERSEAERSEAAGPEPTQPAPPPGPRWGSAQNPHFMVVSYTSLHEDGLNKQVSMQTHIEKT